MAASAIRGNAMLKDVAIYDLTGAPRTQALADNATRQGDVIAALQSLRPHVMGRIIAIVGGVVGLKLAH